MMGWLLRDAPTRSNVADVMRGVGLIAAGSVGEQHTVWHGFVVIVVAAVLSHVVESVLRPTP